MQDLKQEKNEEGLSQTPQKDNDKHGQQWKDFHLHPDLIDALYDDGNPNPTKIQSETLAFFEEKDRKKPSLLLHGPRKSGKTMAYLIPILNSIEFGMQTAEDKIFKEKTLFNEIFKPQAIIIVSTTILQDQTLQILKQYQQFGQNKKSEKLKFKIGRMDKEKHENGDVIVCLPISFVSRFIRGNLNLNNCKFIAIDGIDDIFNQEKQILADILQISETHRPNLISCLPQMHSSLIDFYTWHIKDVIMLNANDTFERTLKEQQIALEESKCTRPALLKKSQIQKDLIGRIFGKIYENTEKKPQVFAFFNTADQIRQFDEQYKTIASDLQQENRAYLPKITTGIIQSYKQRDDKKVAMTITEKTDISHKKIISKQEKPSEAQSINESKSFVEQKLYLNKSKKKWKDFQLHADLIEALYDEGKPNPTRVQSETLEITVNPNRKKFNLLIRAANGSGKTMSFLIPILNSIEPDLKTTEDKTFKGKTLHNEIFKPQGIIIVQTCMLQDQLQRILKQYQQFGENKKSEKLKFKIGRMDKEKHQHGDVIVCMPKSFLNRYQRGNLNLNNCKFIVIDQVNDIFEQEMEVLAEILKISEQNRPNVIACSATMKKEFTSFYENYVKDVIYMNIINTIEQQKLKRQNVKHYYKVATDKSDMHKYVIGTIFKHLYEKVDKKPQVFVFFDSIDQIREFHDYFKARASDFTSDESPYLANLTVDIIAAKKYQANKKVDMTITEKTTVMTKFRNNQTNILLATNIIARGIDVRNACFVINIGPPKTSEKDADIDLDIYMHRVDRHNDKGLALTLIRKEDLQQLVEGIKNIHRIEVHEMKNPEDLVNELKDCIRMNSQ